ncbi:MAG: Fur family transcriptional regulator [Treponema sp.]|nr:MAG: Fur family transcriptional regulator [Treponema sp.]
MSILSRITKENYLKTIVKFLAAPDKDFITTGELAKLMAVTPGTATTMVKRLEKDGYLKHKSHYGTSLTKKGETFGISILRRHRLLETFLEQVLNMKKDEIHNEAENLEHAVSDKLIDLIDAYLGFPNKDPHGEDIPSKTQKTYQLKGQRLCSAPENKLLQVVSFTKSENLKDYFKKIKLNYESKIIVHEKNIETGLAKIIIDNKEVQCAILILDKIIVQEV